MSFSAEVSDFVAGFKAGSAIGGDIQDRKLSREKWEWDKAFDQQKLDLSKARFEDSKASRETRRAAAAASAADKTAAKAEKDRARRSNELLKLDTGSGSRGNRQDYPDEYEGFDEAFPGDEGDSYDSSAIPVEEVDDEEVTSFGNRGGLILHAQEGTVVPPVETQDEEEEAIPLTPPKSEAAPAPASAIPATPPEAPAAEEEPTVNREGKRDPLFKNAADVTRDVMDSMEADLRKKPEAINPESSKSQDRISETKAATPDEIKAIDAKIDPNNEMEPYRKGAARLVDAYNFFVEKGDVEKARRIGAKIIEFNKMASMTLGRLAMDAIQDGDIASASKLVTDAYNNHIPDGGKIEATPTPNGTLIYKIDREGYAQQQGEIGAQQLWQLAGGVANGKEFIKRMTALAADGKPGAAAAGGSGKKGSYSADVRAAAQAQIEYNAMRAEYDNATGEEKRKMRADLVAKQKELSKALERAQFAREKTGRKPKDLKDDLDAALKTVAPPLPSEPAGEKPEAVTYKSEVQKAAKARRELDAMISSYENLDEEQQRAAYPQLQAKQEEYAAAQAAAAAVGDKLGRNANEDIAKTAKNLPSALPLAPPEAPKERTWGEWWRGEEAGSSQAVAQAVPQEAVPTSPAPAPAPAPTSGGNPLPPDLAAKAQDAIKRGAPRAAVIERLQKAGFDTRGL